MRNLLHLQDSPWTPGGAISPQVIRNTQKCHLKHSLWSFSVKLWLWVTFVNSSASCGCRSWSPAPTLAAPPPVAHRWRLCRIWVLQDTGTDGRWTTTSRGHTLTGKRITSPRWAGLGAWWPPELIFQSPNSWEIVKNEGKKQVAGCMRNTPWWSR